MGPQGCPGGTRVRTYVPLETLEMDADQKTKGCRQLNNPGGRQQVVERGLSRKGAKNRCVWLVSTASWKACLTEGSGDGKL
jgi:hypothetical protein